MSIFSNIGSFFKNLFKKAVTTLAAYAKKAWALLEPFIEAFFAEAGKEGMAFLQDLAIAAIHQIQAQGLPTDEAKRQAFEQIMKAEAKKKGIEIKDNMLNWLRENALLIWKNWQATK